MTLSSRALVPFVSVEAMMRLVHSIGLPTVLCELTEAIETDFLRWPEFDKCPRLPAHSPVGVIELMPAADATHYAFKYVNGHPKNAAEGLQTVTAFGLVAEMYTGYPTLLTEMTLLTALRTAATSAMATRALARPDARTLAMIGNGAQAEFQILALQAVCGITDVRLYDTDRAATEKVMRNLAGKGLTLTPCDTPEEAVQGADVITTATADKRNQQILTDNMVGNGVHINAIGGDCPGKTELHRDIVARADMFVEYPEQTRIEGELQQMPADHPYTELWQVLAGQAPGRTRADQITLFDGVGFAIEDFSALRWLESRAIGTPYVQMLDFIADPDDPRDLFGMLERAA